MVTKQAQLWPALTAALVMASGAAFGAAHDGGGGDAPKGAPGAGHCNFVQENMFAGPYKVCESPVDEAGCQELGSTDDNRDAVHGDGDCATEGAVGICDMGDRQLVYYEGDPGGLEIGCGFQGGEWKTP